VHPSLLVGNYEFGNDDEDLALLTVIGAIAESLEAPFIVGATPGLLGCRHFSELPSAGDLEQRLREPVYRNWQALRSSSFAQWLALALPRWLCRLPYGSDTEPIESFTFEEQLDGEHETLLWTSPAWAVTAVVADAFASHGWGFDVSSTVGRLEGLPLYVYREAGNTVTKPCAELVLNERSAGVLGETGLIPLVSYWQQDAVALPYIQSLAHVPLRWRLQRG
jgi:type VI secretion system protein ImpC